MTADVTGARTQRCLYCDALPGEPCVTYVGRKICADHMDRIHAFRAAEAEAVEAVAIRRAVCGSLDERKAL